MGIDIINYRIQKMEDEVKRIKEEAATEISGLLAGEFENVKQQYPNLDVVYIRAYTPSFNDGEECVHRHQVYVENNSKYSDICTFHEIVLDEDVDYDDQPAHIAILNSKLSKKEATKIQEYFLSLNDIMEAAYGTNWYMIINFTGEQVHVKYEEYECGY